MKNKASNKVCNNNFNRIIKILLISLSVFLITLFICSLKKDLFMDEMISYGLANNEMVPSSKDYTSYTGEQLILDYAAVKEGKQFDFNNVIKNQQKDTHPPFWYALLHIISSFNVGKWSLWYGLIINIFLSVIIFWEFRFIYNELIEDNIIATILSYLSMITNAIISSYIFIRMYTLLISITLLFFILIIKQIFYKNKNDNDVSINKKTLLNMLINNRIYIYLYLLIILGTLTHYHYLLVGGLFGIMYCIYLIYDKQFIELLKTISSAILSLFTAYLIFPHIIQHLFFANNLHSLQIREVTTINQNVINFFEYIFDDIFSYSIYLYALILLFFVILFVIKLKKKKVNSNQKFEINNIFINKKIAIYTMIIIVLIIYYIVLLMTIKFKGDRYLLNWFPLFIILIYSGIYNLSKVFIKNYKIFALVVVIITVICSNIKPPKMLYLSDDKISEYFENNSEKKMLICYASGRKWDLATVFYMLRHMKNITVVNASMPEFQKFGDFKNNTDFYVTIYTELNHEKILNSIASVNDVDAYEVQLDLQRYKIYRLFKS